MQNIVYVVLTYIFVAVLSSMLGAQLEMSYDRV